MESCGGVRGTGDSSGESPGGGVCVTKEVMVDRAGAESADFVALAYISFCVAVSALPDTCTLS